MSVRKPDSKGPTATEDEATVNIAKLLFANLDLDDADDTSGDPFPKTIKKVFKYRPRPKDKNQGRANYVPSTPRPLAEDENRPVARIPRPARRDESEDEERVKYLMEKEDGIEGADGMFGEKRYDRRQAEQRGSVDQAGTRGEEPDEEAVERADY